MSNDVCGKQKAGNVGYKKMKDVESFAKRWRKDHEGRSFVTNKIAGFCLLIKRAVIDWIGGLDEQFLIGTYEDDDFCIRAILSGYELRIAEDVFIHHTGSVTFAEAKMDYEKISRKNWEVFKKKWKLPPDSPLSTTYQLNPELLSDMELYIPLPDISVDHRSDHEERYWEDISNRGEGIQGEEKESKVLTSIIVTTAQESDSIKKCIESLRKHTTESYEIIVVSYGKRNKTSNWLRMQTRKDLNLRIIEDSAERRYVEACNLGIQTAKGQYIVLIMDNAVITQGWLSSLTECLQSSPDIGIVGPMTSNIDGPQAIKNFQIKDIEKLDEFAVAFREKNRYRRVNRRTLHGFCLLFERSLQEKIGMFDEQFLTSEYAIDDYCLRAAVKDYKSCIACDSFVDYHNEHALPDVMTVMERTLLHNRELFQDRKYFSDKWSNTNLAPDVVKKLSAINALSYADELRQKGQKNDAVAILLEGLKCAPEEKELHFSLVELLVENNQIKDAMGVLEHMPAELKQDTRWMELTGFCKESLNLNEEAERYADEILVSNEASPKALNLKGVIAYKKKLLADAENYFHEALELDRRWGEPYSNLGAIKWNTGNYEEALNFFETAFILSSTDENIIHNFLSVAVSLTLRKSRESP